MTLSVMVSTADQSIVWVSNSFAEHFGVPSSELIGRPVLELLEGSPGELWQQLFTGIESVDERFDEVRVRRAGEPNSIDDFELRGVRYVDGGRNVMISLRTASSTVGSDESEMLAEVELRHSELLRGSFDGVVVHDGRFVLFVNDVAADLIGVAAADAVGMPIASLINPKREVNVASGDVAVGSSGAHRMRMVLQRVAGAIVEVDTSMALVSWRGRRAVQIVLHDLSLKRHSQRSDAVREVVESAVSDAVVSTDENLRIVDWNPAASELYGWSLDEVVGMSISEVLGPADDSLGIGEKNIYTGARSDVWMGTVSHRHRDGHEVLVESAQIILRDSDRGVGGLLEVNRHAEVTAVDDSTTDEGQGAAQPEAAPFVAEVRAALANGEISVAYQPIVELGTRRLHKVEALARWTHPRRGAINAGQFIPLAERSGIIDELGEWVLARACADVLLMDGEGINVGLSVNLSVVQLRDPAVSRRIARLFTDTGFPPTRLSIEVTESVLLDDKAILPLQVLHDMGAHLVVDDFGTGYATFQYITRLPVDALKIDATFVSGLGVDTRDTAIVRSVINLCRELGLEVVAEGVETELQRSQLLALQCRFGQGWLFGRPMPFAEFVAEYRGSAPAEPGPTTGPAGDEAGRLAVLKASRILDTDPELAFDCLVQLSSQLLSAPMALISFVDADRQWFKARVGVEALEAPRDMFCAQVLAEPLVALIVRDAPGDPRFAASPLVTGPLNIHAYAGAPIRSREGLPLGVLSVLDIRPRDYTAEQIGQLQLLAEQAAALIDLRRSAAELDDFNHIHRAAGAGTTPELLRYGSLEIDLGARTVAIGSRDVETTATEFDLLAFLATRPGYVFSRSELLNHIRGSSSDSQHQATVTEHIYRLRKKIDPDPGKPSLLRTVRGRGYCFGAPTSGRITMANSSDAPPPTLQAAPADAAFDALVRLATRALSVPIASIAILAGEGLAASDGVAVGQAPGDAAFSAQAMTTPDEVLVVADAALDGRFANDAFVVGPPYIRSCAGISIRSREGPPVGTLCVLDTQPRPFSVDQVDLLRALSLQAGALIELRRRVGEVYDLMGRSPGAAVTAAPTTPASPHARRLIPTAKLTAVDPEAATARLVASRSLLRVDTVEAAVGVCIALVRELGGRTIPARLDDGRAIPIDCSFGHGEPLLPVADSPLARLRLERVLPEVLEDARVVISRIRHSDDLYEQTRTDPLTGLMNRRAVDHVLKRLRTDDALVSIDLDHFKSVNDTWGHAAGDDVLIAYSRALRSSGRASDHFARLGGEELLAVLGGANEVGLSAFLGRLHETWIAIRPHEVTYSAGCAWSEGRSGTETLSVADAALFRAKRGGRDQAIIEPRHPAIAAAKSRSSDTSNKGTS